MWLDRQNEIIGETPVSLMPMKGFYTTAFVRNECFSYWMSFMLEFLGIKFRIYD